MLQNRNSDKKLSTLILKKCPILMSYSVFPLKKRNINAEVLVPSARLLAPWMSCCDTLRHVRSADRNGTHEQGPLVISLLYSIP